MGGGGGENGVCVCGRGVWGCIIAPKRSQRNIHRHHTLEQQSMLHFKGYTSLAKSGRDYDA